MLIEVTIDHGRGAMARFADGVQAEIATAEPSLLLTALLKLAGGSASMDVIAGLHVSVLRCHTKVKV